MSYRSAQIPVIFLLLAICLVIPRSANAICGGGLLSYYQNKVGWYYGSSRIEGADLATFHVLSGMGSYAAYNPCARDSGYAADRLHVYRESATLPQADPVTFAFLADGYSRDAHHVYYLVRLIGEADAASFQELNSATKALPKVDSATFQVLGDDELAFSAEDKARYFLGAHPFDRTKCKKVGEAVLACNGYILSVGRKYTEIDPSSIHYLGRFPYLCQVIENSMICQDKNAMYEFYGDGTFMKFLNYQPEKRFESLDKVLEANLCSAPVTQSLRMEQ